MTELGLKVKAIRKRKTKGEKTKDYEVPYEEALKIIKEKGTSKLTRKQCAAILTLGFGEFTGDSGKMDSLRSKVDTGIRRGKTDKDYWKRMEDDASKRRKVDEADC